jgi:hypothetical protein
MQGKNLALFLILFSVFFTSCSRKHQPQAATIEKPAEKVILVKRVPKTPVPKSIIVDDRAAKRSGDGRLFYDLENRRYWKNYDDGKYYLFNKNMFGDSAFKPH